MLNKLIKTTLFASILIVASCNSETRKDTGNDKKKPVTVSYTKNDIVKIKWIEGKWKGMDGSKPFYEIYEMINDSCLKIIFYDWNGKDSSNTKIDFVLWKNESYYLGKNWEYKVTEITDQEIRMITITGLNEISWKYRDSLSWDVTLTGQQQTAKYLMQRFDPFKK